MASKVFKITEHDVPTQHIRNYHRATIDGTDSHVLHLAVKQYTPVDNQTPKSGDVTIIAAHANGFPKELYEPLWIELHARTKAAGVRIRGIWMADIAHQGQSGLLNENKLGNDPSWFDHPRDLLLMINHFREQIHRPIFGIGHSLGGAQLTLLSLFHPRLFAGLVLIDPVMQRHVYSSASEGPARASTFRRDVWPSREAAAQSFQKSKFYQAWDPRVLDLWIEYGLHDLPTATQSTADAPRTTSGVDIKLAPVTTEPTITPTIMPPVTLTTKKAQEVFTFLRPNYINDGPGPHALTKDNWHTNNQNRVTHPDIVPMAQPQAPFYRAEAAYIFNQLQHLRPPVLYVFGETSYLSLPETMEDKLNMTGIGASGSGGVVEGRVKHVIIKDTGHLIPMEKVNDTADNVSKWLLTELEKWKRDDQAVLIEYGKMSKSGKLAIDKRYQDALGGPFKREKKL